MVIDAPDLATAAANELARAERLWYDLEPPEGTQLELIDGELVMSPTPGRAHSNTVTRLSYQLADLAQRRGWEVHANLTVHIPATRERLIPDLMVIPEDAPLFGADEVLAPGVLLAAEVVSPSSRRRDRTDKPRAYSQGRIPLCLLIDPFAAPAAVTLFSQPGQGGYGHQLRATAGQPLRLPEPFDVDLDIARLLG